MNYKSDEAINLFLNREICTEIQAWEFGAFLIANQWDYHPDEHAVDCLSRIVEAGNLTPLHVNRIQTRMDEAYSVADMCDVFLSMTRASYGAGGSEWWENVATPFEKAVRHEPEHLESVLIVRHLSPENARRISNMIDAYEEAEHTAVQVIDQYEDDPAIAEMVAKTF